MLSSETAIIFVGHLLLINVKREEFLFIANYEIIFLELYNITKYTPIKVNTNINNRISNDE